MKNKKNYLFGLLAIALTGLFSCKDDVKPINEEEVINEVTVTLRDGNNTVYTLSYKDADGDGPQSPQITSDKLPANTTLTGTLSLKNTLAEPEEDITEEIHNESDEHQFFYLWSGSPAPSVTYSDTDNNNRPVGLEITLTTHDAYEGTLNLVLRHQPNKDASGVAQGDITNAGGSTDVDLQFPVRVE